MPMICFWLESIGLTHKQLETHGCIISSVATAALVLKHQVTNDLSAKYLLKLTSLIQICYIHNEQNYNLKSYIFEKITQLLNQW